ncbi:hypothetical protein HLG78_00955 [Candidatus Absconditicoccus praedator]|nr:hypothetical protein HLG78_00955 [Candidatus Absconditicoccus praedator]
MNIGLYGILQNVEFWDLSKIFIITLIIGLNIFLYLISYIINYKDGVKIFHVGYYFSWLLLFYEAVGVLSISDIFDVFLIFIVLSFVVYTFIIFILSNFTQINLSYIRNLNFLYFLLFVVVFIYSNLYDTTYVALLISQLFLMIVFGFIYICYKFTKKKEEESKNKIETILSGGSLIEKKQKTIYDLFSDISDFFKNIPEHIKLALALVNLFLMFGQIYIFFLNIGSDDILFYEILYWLGILVFFINFILLKLIDYYYYIQRIMAFFVINFGIYLTILNIFGQDYFYIVVIGILRSIIGSLLIFFSKSFIYKKLLFREDYYFWILANGMAMLLNVYFIFLLDINNALKINFILLYVGLWIFMTFYNIKFLEKKFI